MPRSFIKNVKRMQTNAAFFYKELKITQRSFIKNVKERKERNILFIKNAKERENARSFEKNGCPTLARTE